MMSPNLGYPQKQYYQVKSHLELTLLRIHLIDPLFLLLSALLGAAIKDNLSQNQPLHLAELTFTQRRF